MALLDELIPLPEMATQKAIAEFGLSLSSFEEGIKLLKEVSDSAVPSLADFLFKSGLGTLQRAI